jgi:hypothetical protein
LGIPWLKHFIHVVTFSDCIVFCHASMHHSFHITELAGCSIKGQTHRTAATLRRHTRFVTKMFAITTGILHVSPSKPGAFLKCQELDKQIHKEQGGPAMNMPYGNTRNNSLRMLKKPSAHKIFWLMPPDLTSELTARNPASLKQRPMLNAPPNKSKQ